MIEILANFLGGKQPLDRGDERGQFRGESSPAPLPSTKAEQLLADQIVQRVSRPELLADVLGGGALFDPDLVEGCDGLLIERSFLAKYGAPRCARCAGGGDGRFAESGAA